MSEALSEVDLYEGLSLLLPPQFDELCLRIEVPREYLSGANQAAAAIALVTWARQEPSRLAALGRELARVTAALTDPEDAAMFDRLCKLNDAQFEKVVGKVRMPTADLPGGAASLAQRALALVRWTQQCSAERRPALKRAIDDVLTAGPGGQSRRSVRVVAAVVAMSTVAAVGAIHGRREFWRAEVIGPSSRSRIQLDVQGAVPIFGRPCESPRLLLCIRPPAMRAFHQRTMWPSYLVSSSAVRRSVRLNEDEVDGAVLHRALRVPGRDDCEEHANIVRRTAVSRAGRWRFWRVLVDIDPRARSPEPGRDFELAWSCGDGELRPITLSGAR